MVLGPWRHRQLLFRLIEREVLGRYRGSFGGLLWSLLTPLMMLAIYTFVFGTVFKARWATGGASHLEFAIMVFTGLVVFGVFSECANRAPGLIVSQPNFVKKVVFPLEITPWIALGVALFHAAIGASVLLLAIIVVKGGLAWTALLFPLVVSPVMLLALAVGWFFGALGVFLRDLGQAVGLMTSALLFLSPVFFALESLPADIQTWLALSPIAFSISAAREVLIGGTGPSWPALGAHLSFSALAAWLAFVWFQRVRRGFADVL